MYEITSLTISNRSGKGAWYQLRHNPAPARDQREAGPEHASHFAARRRPGK